MVLSKCEWGHDDYSLNVANLPMQQQTLPEPVAVKKAAPPKEKPTSQTSLFEAGEASSNEGES